MKRANAEEIHDYLLKKNFRVRDTHDNFTIEVCPFCEQNGRPIANKATNKWKLSFAKDGGAYRCVRCEAKGSFYEFQVHRGDILPVWGDKQYKRPEPKALEYPKNVQRKSAQNPVIAWAEERYICKDTLEAFQVGMTTKKFPKPSENGDDTDSWVEQTCITFPVIRNWYHEGKKLKEVTLSVKVRSIEDKANMRIEPAGAEPYFFGAHLIPHGEKRIVITEGECFPGHVQILTSEGWVRFDEYIGQDVAAVTADGKAHFEAPHTFIFKKYSGDLMTYALKGFSVTTTPGHKWVIGSASPQDGEVWTKRPVEEFYGKHSASVIPRAVKIDGPGISLSDDQIALWLAISARAEIGTGLGLTQYAMFDVTSDKRKGCLEELLGRLGIKGALHEIQDRDFHRGKPKQFLQVPLPEWCEGRILPKSWLAALSQKQRLFILDQLEVWGAYRVPNRQQVDYHTEFIENAEWVQTLVHTSGYCATIIPRPRKSGDWFKVSILKGKSYSTLQSGKWSKTPHDGTVYCVQVRTGMIMVRHDQHVSVSGNCDAMAVWQETGYPVVSLPNGCNSLKGELITALDSFETIILALDDDGPGQDATLRLIQRLGRNRCKIVNWRQGVPTNGKDANDALKEGRDIGAIIDAAQMLPHERISRPEAFEASLYELFMNPKATQGVETKRWNHFNRIVNGLRHSELSIWSGNTGSGKCLGKDTPVMLFNGDTKKVQDVSVGDLLMGPDSNPRVVLSTCQGVGPLYRIIPSRGEPWVCNDVHVLSLINSKNGDTIDMPLNEYLEQDDKFKTNYRQWRAPLKFRQELVPQDPYLAGYQEAPLRNDFCDLRKAFIFNSYEVRFNYLAGLLDADEMSNASTFNWHTTSETMANSFVFLCKSLGFYAEKAWRRVRGRMVWRISLLGDMSKIPTIIKQYMRRKSQIVPNVMSFKVEPIGEGEYFGFQLDGDKRFLLGDFTVTHNTTVLSQLSLEWAEQGVPTLWGSFEIGPVKLLKKMLTQHARMTFAGNEDKIGYWLRQLSELPLYILDYYDNVDFQQLVESMEYAVKAYDIRHIILDNLQFFMGTKHVGSAKFDYQDQIIEQLRRFTRDKRVHISLVVHPAKYDDSKELTKMKLFGSVKVIQEAQNIFVLQNNAGNPYILVDKCRETGGKDKDGRPARIHYKYNPSTQEVTESDGSQDEKGNVYAFKSRQDVNQQYGERYR